MKILVLSDSHSAMSFMRRSIDAVKPQLLIHLGDYFDDAETIQEEYSHIPMYHVPGNCDRYRCPPGVPEILILPAGGCRLYMTHGHRHNVKLTRGLLLKDARAAGAAAALYGHTHEAECTLEEDGLWVLNPGSCGYGGGSVGLMEVENGTITNCRILRQEDLEEFK